MAVNDQEMQQLSSLRSDKGDGSKACRHPDALDACATWGMLPQTPAASQWPDSQMRLLPAHFNSERLAMVSHFAFVCSILRQSAAKCPPP